MLQIFKLIKKKKSHRQQNMDQRGRSETLFGCTKGQLKTKDAL